MNSKRPRQILIGTATLLLVIVASFGLTLFALPDPVEIGLLSRNRNTETAVAGAASEKTPTVHVLQDKSPTERTELSPARLEATLIAFKHSQFEGAYIDGVTTISSDLSMVRLIVPKGIDGAFYAIVTVWMPQGFECFPPAWYSDRLYCIGPILPVGVKSHIRVFQGQVGHEIISNPVYETSFDIVAQATAPRDP